MWTALLDRWPRGHTLDEHDWRRRHRLLLAVLAGHAVGLAVLGPVLGHPLPAALVTAAVPAVAAGLGALLRRNRSTAAVVVAIGLACCSAAVDWPAHLFVVVGLVAICQSWRPILTVAAVTLLGHGFSPDLAAIWPGLPLFAPAGPDPWQRGLLQGAAALAVGLAAALVWRATEHAVSERDGLAGRLTDIELDRRHFVAELLVSLARRSQSATYRQLEILARLRTAEHDQQTAAELSRLDHLAGRARRTAENLLVLAGEQPPRSAGEPVALAQVVRAAVAETEDADRVRATVDDRAAVTGRVAADVTHLLAELIENAVRFSPPDSTVTVACRTDHRHGARLVIVRDHGVGMPATALADANAVLAEPREVDLSVSQRLGLPVVARLAQRHEIQVTLTAGEGAGAGIVCAVALPAALFTGQRFAPDDDADTPTRSLRALDGSAPAVEPAAPVPPAPVTEPTAPAGPAPAAAVGHTVPTHPADATAPAGPTTPDDPRPPTPAGTSGPAERPDRADPRPTQPAGTPGPAERPDPTAEPDWSWLGATRPAADDEPVVLGGDSPSGVDLFRPLTEADPDHPAAPAGTDDPSTTAIPIVATTDPPAAGPGPRPGPADDLTRRIPLPTPAEPGPGEPVTAEPVTAEPGPRGAPDPGTDVGSATAVTRRIQLPVVRPPTSPQSGTPDAAPAPAPPPVPDPATRIPAQTTPPDAGFRPGEPVPLPVRRSPAAGARASLPGPFGSTGTWSGWWHADADATGRPDSEVPHGALPSPRPRPPAGLFRSDTRRNETAAERQPRPFDYPPTTQPPSPQPDTPPADRAGPHTTGPVTWVEPVAAVPDPTPGRPAAADQDDRTELGKRVPQANLSRHLRVPAPAPGPRVPADPERSAEAASALSRYQASRQAARVAVGDTADTMRPRPGSDARPVAVAARSEPPSEQPDSGSGDGAVTDRASADAGPEAAGDERSTAQDAAAPEVPGDPDPDATDGQH